MLVIECCLDLDSTVYSKSKWFGTRSPNSMNALDSIFCTRLGGTGDIDEPGVEARVTKYVGVVGHGALLYFGGSTLTWSRSRPEG